MYLVSSQLDDLRFRIRHSLSIRWICRKLMHTKCALRCNTFLSLSFLSSLACFPFLASHTYFSFLSLNMTRESRQTLCDHGFASLISQYEERESQICGPKSASHPLHSHDLSRTSFEPYTSTPFYLKLANNNPGELRDYQLMGVNWMISRMKKGLSVLLADEMGLGKTIQTISVIGHLMYAELLVGPFLVIVPQSTTDNWVAEFKRWLPLANVVVYHGNPQARDLIRTFEMCRTKVQPFACYSEGVGVSHQQQPGRLLPPSNRRTRIRCDVCIATPSILNNADDSDFLKGIPW